MQYLSIQKSFLLAIGVVCGLLITMSGVSAHNGVASFEKESDGYWIDIGYSPELVVADTSMEFDFGLLNSETLEDIPFTKVQVRLSDGTEAVFSGELQRAEQGFTFLTYTFPEAGDYTLSVRYLVDGEWVANENFTLTVNENLSGGGNSPWGMLIAGFMGIFLGFAVAFMIKRG